MARIIDSSPPAMQASAQEWLDYWVRIRTQTKPWDYALSRHAMKEIKRLSKLVKTSG